LADIWSELEEVIAGLTSVSDIRAAAVVRRDGLIITHSLPEGVDPRTTAAMTAAIVGTSEMATVQLGQGRFEQALIESEGGKLVSTGAGDQALVIALAYKDANLGLVLMALQKASRKVDEILRRAESR
jgi:predicted regulator of Ras-like GTPase activity (Roadblock/LC7/MglB family)